MSQNHAANFFSSDFLGLTVQYIFKKGRMYFLCLESKLFYLVNCDFLKSKDILRWATFLS